MEEVGALRGRFAGLPNKFPSLSVCAIQARSPAARHLSSESVKARIPPEVRVAVFLVVIPGAGGQQVATSATDHSATNPDNNSSSDSNNPQDDWVDERAVSAAAGRLLIVAMAVASNVIFINGSSRVDWRHWHAMLRHSLRSPSWDLPILGACRRDEAATVTYVTVRTSTDHAPAVSESSDAAADDSTSPQCNVINVFDPLTDLIVDTAQAAGPDDPNWLDYGLINRTSSIRGFLVQLRKRGPGQREALELPDDITRAIVPAAARPLSIAPLFSGSAHGGFFTWPDLASIIITVVSKARNPAASIVNVVTNPSLAHCFTPLVQSAYRFYCAAMDIEINDAARPEVPYWVNVMDTTQRVSRELDRAYATTLSASASHRGRSGVPSSLHTSEVGDDGDEAADDAATDTAAGNVGALEDEESLDASQPVEPEDFVPVTPSEYMQAAEASAAAVAASDIDDHGAALPLAAPSDGASSPRLEMPMDSEDLLDAHERYFAAAMRRLMHALLQADSNPMKCAVEQSVDLTSGQELLRTLKTQLTQQCRALWGANMIRSRVYCEKVAQRTFAPLRQKFTREHSTGLRGPNGVKRWYAAVRAHIEEYVVKAKGGRKLDILATYTKHTLIPEFLAACEANDVDKQLCDITANSLSKEVLEMHSRHIAERDQEVSDRQTTIELLSVLINAEWTEAAAANDYAKLRSDLSDDTIADWVHRTQETLMRLRLAGARIPDNVVETEEQWKQMLETHLESITARKTEATQTKQHVAFRLAQRSTEVHSTTTARAMERQQREQQASGVVRIFNMLQSNISRR
jgi:hypothetical protein